MVKRFYVSESALVFVMLTSQVIVNNKLLPVSPDGNRARGEQAESHEATAPELAFGICCEWSHRLFNAMRLILSTESTE